MTHTLIALVAVTLTHAAEPRAKADPTLLLSSPNPYRVLPQDGPEALMVQWGGQRQLNDSHPEDLLTWDETHAIAASTLPSLGRSHPRAHQDVVFEGEGSIFSSHRNLTGQPLHQDLVLFNPTGRIVHVRVHALASTTTAEAPYRTGWLDFLYEPAQRATLPDSGLRRSYGPGERTARRILQGEVEGPDTLLLQPGAVAILHSALHPVGQELVTQAEFHTDGPVHAALVSRYGDSASANVGSYGADIQIRFPVVNPTGHARRVQVFFDSPAGGNAYAGPAIRNPLTVAVDGGTRTFSLEQTSGTRSARPVVDLVVKPGATEMATLRFINAADNLPPYRIRVETR